MDDGAGTAGRAAVIRALAAREVDARARADQLAAQLGAFAEAVAGSNADDEHDPEGATLAFERQQLAALRRQVEAELTELADARVRVDAGTYGCCEVCGGAIPVARLAARPTARTCVACAESARTGRGFGPPSLWT